MSKMNNKGFLLAESLIVSTFVLTVLMFLFVQFRNLMSNYKTTYIYNSVEDIYSLGSLADYLKTYEDTNNTLNNQLESNKFFYVYNNNECQTDDIKLKPGFSKDTCTEIGNALELDYAIYTNSDISEIKNSINNITLDNDMKNFIKKVDTTLVENKGRLIAKFKNGHFATVAINTAKPRLTPLIKSFDSETTLIKNTGILRASIAQIVFEDNTDVPNGAKSWDVSAVANSGAVMAWVTPYPADSSKYVLHIGGDGGVYANEDSSYIFTNFRQLKSIDFTHYITSYEMNGEIKSITNMGHMFEGCMNLATIDLSSFDMSNVTDMQHLFEGCSALSSIDLSQFNTSNVTNMSYMFSGCENLGSLSFGENFDTSKVEDMQYMFNRCSMLTSLDLSNFDTSKVTNMGVMFQDCINLKSINLKSFDTSKVTNMNAMFNICKELISLDLSNFNTQEVTGTNSMFNGCTKLKTIIASDNFAVNKVSSEGGENAKDAHMFEGCTNLVGGNGTTYDSNHINKEYARIDASGTPGYFTAKTSE